MYIDKDNKLHVGPGEIPSAESITFGDERYMAEPDNPIAEATAETLRDLQERSAELDQRELSVAASELRMKELRTTCIEILFYNAHQVNPMRKNNKYGFFHCTTP